MLTGIAHWPVAHVAGAVITSAGVVAHAGDTTRDFELASVTKPVVAYAALIAVEEGIITLDEPIDDDVDPDLASAGVTLRHLLAHASGLPFEGDRPLAGPGTRRIYSNTGFDRIAAAVAQAAQMPFDTYLSEAVLHPLGMSASRLAGGPAAGMRSTVDDLCRFTAELQAPTLVCGQTATAMRTVQFPELAGVVPGIGRFDPCPWGLGVEIKGSKRPHWMGTRNSPGTFGHFGGSGTFLWVDEGARCALVVLTDRPFASWADDALRLWPALGDHVIGQLSTGRAG